MPIDLRMSANLIGEGSGRPAVKATRMTRRGPRSELEVGLVRASLLAHGSRRGLETTRQAVEVPGAPRGLEIILAPGIDAPSQGRHYRAGVSYARLRFCARGLPGDRARIPRGRDGSRSG